MTDKSDDQTSETPHSDRPPLADQIRAKMDEYDVDRHLNDLASTLEQAVRTGMAKAGEFAHEHKGDLERLFDKAADAVDRRTDGKHADTIQQVRGSLERGVDKIADQRADGTPEEPGSDVPPSNG
jgi:RNA-splicing ligase RtcB